MGNPFGQVSKHPLANAGNAHQGKDDTHKENRPKGDRQLMPCPRTKLKAVNAVSEIAQPIAIGRLAHRPISSEPKAAIRQVAINTEPGSNPAFPSMEGTTITE